LDHTLQCGVVEILHRRPQEAEKGEQDEEDQDYEKGIFQESKTMFFHN